MLYDTSGTQTSGLHFSGVFLVTVLVIIDGIFFQNKGNKRIFLLFFTKKHKGNNMKKPNNFNSFVQREIKEPSQLRKG
jgi:hypothetical protein